MPRPSPILDALRMRAWPWWEAGLTVVAAVMFALAAYHALIDSTRTWDYNVVRLQRSFVLAAGEPIYAALDSGVILNTIYGPVGALAYLPATVMRSPVAAVLAGQTLSLVMLTVPVFVLLFRAEPRRGRSVGTVVTAFLLFGAVLIDLRPLEYAAFTVHVDAPAIALALLAWAVLLRARPPNEVRYFLWASLFMALALWTKLMVLPLPAAMALWAFVTGGMRRALRLSVCMALVLGVVSACMVLAFGPAEELFFNLWTVPSLHTVGQVVLPERLARGIMRFFWETPMLWFLWSIVFFLRFRRSPDWRHEPALTYGFLGLALLPFSVFGFVKQGGDINAFAYSTFFVLVGSVLSLAQEARRSLPVRRGTMGLTLMALSVVVLIQEPQSLRTWREPIEVSKLPHQLAYEYALEHPGEMYFPRFTLSSFLAEGRIYHQSVGLHDRKVADLRPSVEHLRAHLPENLQGIAFYVNAFELEIQLIDLPFRRSTQEPELPGFVVFRRGE